MPSSTNRFARRMTRRMLGGVPSLTGQLSARMARTRRLQQRLLDGTSPLRGASKRWTPTPSAAPRDRAAAAARTTSTTASGTVTRGRSGAGHGALDWRLFTPKTGSGQRSLVVMLHGCTQDAEDFARGTRMDAVAAERGCCVLYPEQSTKANPQRCWNWFKQVHQRAGRGEPAALLDLIEATVVAQGIDRSRVFVAGLSAGGAMAAILGQQAPDVIAGVGVHSGLGAGAARDMPSAFAAMQGNGAVLLDAAGPPAIVLHGDADTTVHPSNAQQIVEAHTRAAPALLQSSRGLQVNGRSVAVSAWQDVATGAARVEHWSIGGAGHAWSGGDAAGSYTDATGPDASRELLDFFLERSRRDRRAA